MEQVKKKTAVPQPPVGPGEGQPISYVSTESIAEDFEKSNPLGQEVETFWQFTPEDDPSYLPALSMNELFERVYPGNPPVIEGLLYAGVYLFAGAAKTGKSFLMVQLAYHVSKGLPLWGYPVRSGTVLYLALEDDYHRLQERLYRMFGTDSAENLYFSVKAHTLDEELEKQLRGFFQEHPDTRLVIIDILQKVREAGEDRYSYASDYEVITQFKQFAAETGICLLLVHHTRKQQADDRFDMISGTNGLFGAADGAFLLQKERRTDNMATLDIAGRDQQDQRLHLKRNEEKLVWDLVRRETELWREPPDPVLEAVAALVTAERPEWKGTATELVAALGVEMKPNALAMRLNIRACRLSSEHHIRYESFRTHIGRRILLTFEPSQA